MPGVGDYPLFAGTCYSIELNVTASVPEWGGQDVQFALEQDAVFDRPRSPLPGRPPDGLPSDPLTMPAEPTPFQKIIRQRRSIRRYLPAPVEKEKIQACLEAARIAPSAQNAQSWRFLVIDDPEIKDRFAEKAFSGIYKMTRFAAQAPVLVLVLAELDVLANRLGPAGPGRAISTCSISASPASISSCRPRSWA